MSSAEHNTLQKAIIKFIFLSSCTFQQLSTAQVCGRVRIACRELNAGGAAIPATLVGVCAWKVLTGGP